MSRQAFYAAILLLCGAVTVFATAQSEGAGKAAGADRLKAVGFHATGLPLVDQKVTVRATILRPPYAPVPYDEMTLIKDLQHKANVDILFEELPQAQLQEKINLMFASREFPQVMFNAGVTDKNTWDGAQGGDIWPLNDLIESYAPNWKRAFEERPIIKRAITMPDGKIYSLPYYREILNDYGVRDVQAINADWLKKAGKAVPTTTEELYQVLKAFRKGIDEGTLPKNGVPWYLRFHEWIGGEWEIYGAFGIWMKGQPGSTYLSVNGGKVEFGATDPALKDAVAYLNRLYSEKLIPEEAFTDKWEDYIAKTRSVPPITGAWSSYFITEPVEQWFDPLPVLKGPKGIQRYRSQPVRLQTNMFTIFKKFDVPEVMVRFIDYWADDTFSVQASYGGPAIVKNADGTQTVTGGDNLWYTHGPHNQFPTYISKRASDTVRWTGEQGARDSYIRQYFLPHVWPQDRHFTYVTYTDKEREELSVAETEINTYIKTTIARWISKGGADKEWDAYLAQLDKLGLPRLIKLYQGAYDRFSGK